MDQLPPTRAKSPKLGRRKSNSGANNSFEGVKEKGAVAQRKHRTSNANNGNLSNVNNDVENKIEHTKLIEEVNTIKVTGQGDMEISSKSSFQ